ncbi:hypothetical protein BCAR13_840140 [Paraburkholderia caribensis]|nr:hypothetical protein BCAR13_840140 [Paraburkholderia caribensis]
MRASVCATLLSIVPPNSGCGCATSAMPRGAAPPSRLASGASTATSILPTGPSIRYFFVCTFILYGRVTRLKRYGSAVDQQALDNLAVGEMRIDDLVDIALVDVRVPDAFRIHDDRRPFLAAVETPRLVDAHLAGTGKAELFHAFLRVFLHFLRAAVRAARTRCARFALIQTEKDVILEEGIHGGRRVRCVDEALRMRDAARRKRR